MHLFCFRCFSKYWCWFLAFTKGGKSACPKGILAKKNFLFFHPFKSINSQPTGLLKIALIVTPLLPDSLWTVLISRATGFRQAFRRHSVMTSLSWTWTVNHCIIYMFNLLKTVSNNYSAKKIFFPKVFFFRTLWEDYHAASISACHYGFTLAILFLFFSSWELYLPHAVICPHNYELVP